MSAKRRAIPLPDLTGKRVLDVGCDMAYWTRLAVQEGAADALGLDRNRKVWGEAVDLIEFNRNSSPEPCRFEKIDLGKQWREFGKFDVVFCFSMYHHWFENCGDHLPIWLWLYRHVAQGGEVLWEGPTDDSDPVVRKNISDANRPGYTLSNILSAAGRYFTMERIGPALHEPTREVWRFSPRDLFEQEVVGLMVTGAGGASKAFEHEGGRRIREIERIVGMHPVPGSLNIDLYKPFDWDGGYYRAQVLDVTDRSKGLEGEWAPRWARFYPMTLRGVPVFAFRFEGERYNARFLEVISDRRLRDVVAGPAVTLCM